MKALHFFRHGELDVVQYGDVPDPLPKAGQVLVKVRACAGKLKPVIDRVMPLSQGIEAYRIIERGEQFGKIVLIP